MYEHEAGGKVIAETAQDEPREGKKYIRASKDTFKRIAAGQQPYIIERNADGYKVGDVLVIQAFESGRNTGEQMDVVVICKDDGTTSTAITDGYCVLGIKQEEKKA